jgi:hypothetical protein
MVKQKKYRPNVETYDLLTLKTPFFIQKCHCSNTFNTSFNELYELHEFSFVLNVQKEIRVIGMIR